MLSWLLSFCFNAMNNHYQMSVFYVDMFCHVMLVFKYIK